MNPETVNALKGLADAGIDVVLMIAVGVLWRWGLAKDVVIAELQSARLEQTKTDADRLLDERTMVLPIVERSTDALRRTTDQLALTTSLVVEQRDQLARHNPRGNR